MAAAATAMAGATDNTHYLKEAANETGGGGGGCGGDNGSDDGGNDNKDDGGGGNNGGNGDGDCRRLMDAMVKVRPCWLLAQGWRQTTLLFFLFVRTCASGQGRVLLVAGKVCFIYVFEAEPLDKA